MPLLLDTNIVIALLRGEEAVRRRLAAAILAGHDLVLNGITYYEVRRGLLHGRRPRQLAGFQRISQDMAFRAFDDVRYYDEAAPVWAELRAGGAPASDDADVLIAAMARLDGCTVISRDRDLARVGGVAVEAW